MNAVPFQRVLLADRDADVRRALALLLRTALGLQVVGELPDLCGLATAGAPHADLLLIDWASAADHGAQLLHRLHSLNAGIKIIVLSTRPEDRAPALAAGADAFISKVEAPEQVLAVVRAVLASDPA
jgi:DNA-binding NarL/FixJ family response regulator